MSRLAVINKDKCKPNVCNWECEKSCPVNMTGADCIFKGPDGKARIDEILCTGCGICPKQCPFGAITIINLPEVLSRSPIHQFGENGFRIFDLPIVQEGKITGILGRNGIGKSTVINVLSNTLNANFGDFSGSEDEFSKKDYFRKLNELFKGSLLQEYFLKLERGDMKVSYKPQQIINIPKMFKGKVRDLFLRVNSDEKKIEDIALRLGINMVLDRDIGVLSGGELQRVAIEACLLKEEANFYIFDEITNYLDIFQRLNVSRLIKENVEGDTALVVEHDLVVLDFLVDYIHIMYGEPGAYGTMTGVKASKVGINSYLEGFSKEENVRFRDKPITFEKESVGEAKRVSILSRWEKTTLEVGDFKLDIEGGDIKRGEIIGIIGRNALGKSTFVQSVAENGLDDEGVAISYKPQLIPKSENTVYEELCQFSNFSDNFYEVYVLTPLNIYSILEKRVDNLSGGELQRFAIAKCLLDEADLYLIDEPTAFLDVEDRLKISKMIKNFMTSREKSAFIIDHDLVFMDYLSDKLQVFSGKPSVHGVANKAEPMRDGMNRFLRELDVTFRRDENNKRPRVNKPGSVKDSKQKKEGEYYYV